MTKLQQAQRDQKRIVLVTGVFDLLHAAHKQFLQAAKAEGDFLIVGIETDERVRQIKGEGRPLQSQTQRLAQLTELPYVDEAFLLPNEFSKPEHHRQLLAEVKPAVLAVSSHTNHLEKKRTLVEEAGGTLKIVMQHDPSISTTQLAKDSLHA